MVEAAKREGVSNVVGDENTVEGSGHTEDTSPEIQVFKNNKPLKHHSIQSGAPNGIETDCELADTMSSDVEAGIEEEWLEETDIADPAILEKIISAAKVIWMVMHVFHIYWGNVIIHMLHQPSKSKLFLISFLKP